MIAPRQPMVSTVMAALAALVVGTFTGTALAQTTPAQRVTSYFVDRCLKIFPDLDQITATAERSGWTAVARATESRRKGPHYSESYLLDDKQTGEVTGLEIRSVGQNAYCEIGSQ